MEARDELLSIAEIAMTLAGFSGVVAAFLERGGLLPADRFRFVALFITAFVALVLSFVPIALGYAGLEGADLWRLSSGVMMVFGILSLAPYPAGLRRVRGDVQTTARFTLILLLIPAVGNVVLQALNMAPFFWQPTFLPYLVGMLTWLYAAGLIFITIVLYRPQG